MFSTVISMQAALSVAGSVFAQSSSSAGALPLMGYNTYNAASCSPNDTFVTQTIDTLGSKGYISAGYRYFQIDCGWVAKDLQRNSNGTLKIDQTNFPRGLKPLSDYARSKGMKWSMYTDAGVRVCDPISPSPRLGSLDHEQADASYFASLNTEYVKYDNCYASGPAVSQNAPKDPRTDFPSRFGKMWTALNNVGITQMLICQWGTPFSTSSGLQGPASWTPPISTSFRLSDDIAQGFSNVQRIMNEAIHIVGNGRSGPGNFADADLLEVGNTGMSVAEQRSHFAFWAMIKSALFISTDLRRLSSDASAILLNRGLIAINQDALATPVKLVQRWTNDRDLYSGPLSGGDVAALAIDQSNAARKLTINFSDLGISTATVADLWTGQTVSGAKSYSYNVAAHGSVALRLSNVVKAATTLQNVTYYEAENAVIKGKASVRTCGGCSGGKKVGNFGKGGSITFNSITASKPTSTLVVDYVNCEIGYLGNGTNERFAEIKVNDGSAQLVSFPISGYNWDQDVTKQYRVDLSGFVAGAKNTISITGNSSGIAPDFDRIGVLL